MEHSNPFQAPETAGAFFRQVRAVPALSNTDVAILFELSPAELDRADGGDLTVWTDRCTDAYRERFNARIATKLAALERQVAQSEADIALAHRALVLWETHDIPKHLTLGAAIDAEYLTEADAANAIGARWRTLEVQP